MTPQKLIDLAKTITENDNNYYKLLDDIEYYLKNLPDKSHLDKAREALRIGRIHGMNKNFRTQSLNQIISVLESVCEIQGGVLIETTNPLTQIFQNSKLALAKEQFDKAIVFKNTGYHDEAITTICRAMESEMKVICEYIGIPYDEKDTFVKLADKMYEHNIVPKQGMLSGYPIVRNKSTGHGIDQNTYIPGKSDAEFEINRGASLMVYLYQKSGMGDNLDG